MKTLKLIIDENTLVEYEKYYFALHPRARKRPIAQPYHESINKWFIMKRVQMNALKQRWKDFIVWFVKSKELDSRHIEKCKMKFVTYFPTNIRHDCDNYVPKFILDGLVEGGLVVDDDFKHTQSLTLEGDVDGSRPRTEITIYIYE